MSRFSDDLLEQARQLARADQKKPRQANLRRAISTAYYALFHFLIDEAAAYVVGVGPNRQKTNLRQLVGRFFTHTQIKGACVEVLKSTPIDALKPFWRDLDISNQKELRSVAETFRDIQEERHRADYDLSRNFTRFETEAIIFRVENAIRDWNSIKKSQPEVAHFFALAMIMVDGWRKR